MDLDEKYMKEAIRQAKKAYVLEEVPIGCVIVYQGKIIGRGYNRRTVDKNTLAHAELIAIKKASKKLNDWRLEECTMYVTLEPCQMCSGAIVQARIPRVVVGCMNPKAGCAGSILNLLDMKEFNHQVDLTTGVLGEECSEMIKQFFRELREKQKKLKEKLQAYMEYNVNPNKEILFKGYDPFPLELENVQVTGVALATDQKGNAFYQQAVGFMHENLATEAVSVWMERSRQAEDLERAEKRYEEKEKSNHTSLKSLQQQQEEQKQKEEQKKAEEKNAQEEQEYLPAETEREKQEFPAAQNPLETIK